MEVRPGQRLSTIAQAMAHNTNTVRGDMDMLRELCVARGHNHVIDKLQAALKHLDGAYEEFLTIFADELRHDLEHHGDTADPEYHHGGERPASDIPSLSGDHDHPHDHQHPHTHMKGTDRQILADAGLLGDPAAERAVVQAERYETR